ncbi:fumarate reductase (quinol) flavoprotein subunit [Cellulomonas denverensis]|uniref:succinate dehydrogenase n=1 Tax=Cellulomonas denverensis TaxID=264297 RepID=A0A7X6KTZ5_9CELL|nr:fumarate reductase (quinol) flavoprotein subunit [Cellulomonas denverensis]NKY22050.1 fumarate reductase (quinol) flavoprotein subunit [Cellulomonas denverensis]GIG27211.1 fumarate reductase flavoprotein subunit [Cellulomonas denverensis]
MQTIRTDVAVIGGGGAGLRAAIAAVTANPGLDVTILSKVYPMRSHTVAAEGGAAGVVGAEDSLEQHFADTVSGGDWLCDQDVVQYFVEHAAEEMYQLERWGCPWSRKDDGSVNVRRFGGMSRPRTWFAADKTGFHLLHTLFQTSLAHPGIRRLDECLALELVTRDDRVAGVLAYDQREGYPVLVEAGAVIVATGGAGRVYAQNTNGAIVTGDGMAMAYRAGAALRDMEFVQYHPTGLPGSGILITEGCRGEGGVLLNADGRRYLQDYGLGPETPIGEPKNKYMELGPRDRLSQAFWHEQQAGRTIPTPRGDVVHLDLRHLGSAYLRERLPLICELAEQYIGIDPATTPIPVCPTAHYTMGGIETDLTTATALTGLYAVGECASSGLHGANRLGSNSLAELAVLGRVAGEQAAAHALAEPAGPDPRVRRAAADAADRQLSLMGRGTESPAEIRAELGRTMDEGVGIFRTAEGMRATSAKLTELRTRYADVQVVDTCPVYNTDWAGAIELGAMLDVAEAMVYSALGREESRGSHQRLDGFTERDDQRFLAHTQAWRTPDGPPSLTYQPVTITTSPPATRAYGDAGKQAESAPTGGSTR